MPHLPDTCKALTQRMPVGSMQRHGFQGLHCELKRLLSRTGYCDDVAREVDRDRTRLQAPSQSSGAPAVGRAGRRPAPLLHQGTWLTHLETLHQLPCHGSDPLGCSSQLCFVLLGNVPRRCSMPPISSPLGIALGGGGLFCCLLGSALGAGGIFCCLRCLYWPLACCSGACSARCM